MNLTHDWRRLLRKAWSIRFLALAALFQALEQLLPLYLESLPRGLFFVLSMFFTIGAGVARIVDQPKMYGSQDD